jgi:hypothetical protein
VITDRTLRRWYRTYNDKYFGGRLDDDVDVFFCKIPGYYAYVEGETNCVSFDIRVCHTLQNDVKGARRYLLHEMVHVEHWPKTWHNEKFYNRIAELVQAGAYKGLL